MDKHYTTKQQIPSTICRTSLLTECAKYLKLEGNNREIL